MREIKTNVDGSRTLVISGKELHSLEQIAIKLFSRCTPEQALKYFSDNPDEVETTGKHHINDLIRSSASGQENLTFYSVNGKPSIKVKADTQKEMVQNFIQLLFPRLQGEATLAQKNLAAWFIWHGGQSLMTMTRDGLGELEIPLQGANIQTVAEFGADYYLDISTESGGQGYKVKIQYPHKVVQLLLDNEPFQIYIVENKEGKLATIENNEILELIKLRQVPLDHPAYEEIVGLFAGELKTLKDDNGKLIQVYDFVVPDIVRTEIDLSVNAPHPDAGPEDIQVSIDRFENTTSCIDLSFKMPAPTVKDAVSMFSGWLKDKVASTRTSVFGHENKTLQYKEEDLARSMAFSTVKDQELTEDNEVSVENAIRPAINQELAVLFPYESSTPLQAFPAMQSKSGEFHLRKIPGGDDAVRTFQFELPVKIFILTNADNTELHYQILSKLQHMQNLTSQQFEMLRSGVDSKDPRREFLSKHCHRLDDPQTLHRDFGLDPIMTCKGAVRVTKDESGVYHPEIVSCQLDVTKELAIDLQRNKFAVEDFENLHKFVEDQRSNSQKPLSR